MNKKNMNAILEQYISRFDELNDRYGNDEGYKWRAESCFKENWDIDAPDFQSMFTASMKETSNLIDNASVQPIGGIRLLLKQETEIEFVRTCFRELFSEDGGDLLNRQDRIEKFAEKINERIDKYASGSWKYPQSRNSAIYYINLWRPEDNYIFKATEANNWANCVEYGDDFGSGTNFSLAKYYSMCDELLYAVKDNTQLLQLNEERVKREAIGFDDRSHILVYDIIYCAYKYLFYNNVRIKKTSTKERISRAADRESAESIGVEIKTKQEQLEQLSEIKPFPDLLGETVTHKTYGKGTVVSTNNAMVVISFSVGEKKFQFPDAFTNGYLSTDKTEYMVLLKKNTEEEKTRTLLEKELSDLENELSILILKADL